MGQQQSKHELLYQQVNYGNVEGVKSLFRNGASLEWTDRDGKTPLILACMNPALFNVAKTLIELGANVNAYRPGRHAGTPLHHAAKRGLEQTVKLLLSHGANALAMNDDCQTPLDVARAKGFSNVVREIESHICLFSGWLREFYGPGFLESLAPKLVSRNVWVVILPCGSRKNTRPFKLELAIYSSPKDAQPRTVIALWKANLEEANFNQQDQTATIVDHSTKTRIKFAVANENEKQQLRWFCDACKGIPQVMPPAFAHESQSSVFQPSAPPATEDLELDMALDAAIQSSAVERPSGSMQHPDFQKGASTSQNNFHDFPTKEQSSHLAADEAGPSGTSVPSAEPSIVPPNSVPSAPPAEPTDVSPDSLPSGCSAEPSDVSLDSVPSAPPTVNSTSEDGAPLYPQIDSSPVDLSVDNENIPPGKEMKKEEHSTCVVCLDAPVEGACVPCGHMAGCMSCLNQIKLKKWGCPVCRTKIEQVIRLYAV